MNIRINTYSLRNEYKEVGRCGYIGNISDKMIRLAARFTERKACDIVADIKTLQKAIIEKKPHDVLLFFHENGIAARETESFDERVYKSISSSFAPMQVWRLTYNPDTSETKLVRVLIGRS